MDVEKYWLQSVLDLVMLIITDERVHISNHNLFYIITDIFLNFGHYHFIDTRVNFS